MSYFIAKGPTMRTDDKTDFDIITDTSWTANVTTCRTLIVRAGATLTVGVSAGDGARIVADKTISVEAGGTISGIAGPAFGGVPGISQNGQNSGKGPTVGAGGAGGSGDAGAGGSGGVTIAPTWPHQLDAHYLTTSAIGAGSGGGAGSPETDPLVDPGGDGGTGAQCLTLSAGLIQIAGNVSVAGLPGSDAPAAGMGAGRGGGGGGQGGSLVLEADAIVLESTAVLDVSGGAGGAGSGTGTDGAPGDDGAERLLTERLIDDR